MTMKHISLGNNAFDNTQEIFLPVDTDKERKALEKDGMANGQVNAPSAQATQLDAIEQGIVQQIAQTAQLTHTGLSKHFDAFFDRLTGIIKTLNPKAMIDRIQSIPSKMKTDLDNNINIFEATSAIKEPAWRGAQKAYADFRQKHGVIRPSNHHPLRFIIIGGLCLMAVEAAFNAALLWELTGILTAFGQTFLITAVNVIIGGFLVGLPWRHKNCGPPSDRRFMWISIPFLLLILIFNLGVGHYRDALVEYKEQAERQQTELNWDEIAEDIDLVNYSKIAMASMRAGLFEIKSTLSYLMAIVGMGFFVIATCEWYLMLDPLPGYRKSYLAMEKAHKDYINLVEGARNNINNTIKDAEYRVMDERTKVMNMRDLHSNLIERAKTLHDEYPKWVLVLEKTQNHLLAVYRDSNLRARGEPGPRHFNNELPIDPEFTEAPEFQPPELEHTEKVVTAVNEILNKMQGIADAAWVRFNSRATMQLGTDDATQEQ